MSVTGEDALAEEFRQHRTHLIGVAYRLTSTLADAEDAVQEAWLRLATLPRAERDAIRDLRAWLTTVTGRLCLDRLRSAAVRRETYVGPWLPEPVVTPLPGQPGENPAEAIVRDDQVRMAALVVLDRLPAEQRVAFVLHDAFGCSFAEIAEALGCAVATARQYASRGRRAVANAEPPARVELAEQQEVLAKLTTAIASGDLQAALEVLHPQAVLIGDSNGKGRTARQYVRGSDKVGRFLLGLLQRYGDTVTTNVKPVLVNGDIGIAVPPTEALPGKQPVEDWHIFTFAIEDGRVRYLYDIVNPDKLTRVPGVGDNPLWTT